MEYPAEPTLSVAASSVMPVTDGSAKVAPRRRGRLPRIVAVASAVSVVMLGAALFFRSRGQGESASPTKGQTNTEMVESNAANAKRLADSCKPAATASAEDKPLPSLASRGGNIDWSPGDAEGALPGLVPRPAKLPGIGRWQVATRVSRGGHWSGNTLAFSPDGRWFATVADEGQLRIYDAVTRELDCILAGHATAIRAVAWSPDGETIATAGLDREIRLWNRRQRKTVGVLRGHKGEVACLAWSREGRLASGGSWSDNSVRIWNREGNPEAVIDYGSPIEAVAWDPNSERLALAGRSNGIWIVTADGNRDRVLETNGRAACVAFSGDGQRLAAGADRVVNVWDTDTWRPLESRQPSRSSTVSDLAFSHRGNVLADVATDGLVSLSDCLTGVVTASARSGNAGGSVAWSPDDEFLAVRDAYGCIRFCHRDLTPAGRELAGTRATLTFGSNGLCAAKLQSVTGAVRFFDRDGQRLHSIADVTVGQIAWSPDGALVAAASYNPATCSIWDAAAGEVLCKWPAWLGEGALCFSPDGRRLATAGTDKVVRIWSTEGKQLAESAEQPRPILKMAWRPDGRQLALVDTERQPLQILDAGEPSLKPLRTIQLPAHPCYDIKWSPGGTRLLVAGSGHWAVYTLNPDNSEMVILGSDALSSATLAVVWSPDEQRVAFAGSSAMCRLWSLDGTPGPILRGHGAPASDIAFVDEGRAVVSAASDSTIIKWDTATGEPLETSLLLPNDQFVVFGPGGDVRFATPQADDELIYLVENPSGEQEMLAPQEFRRRLEASSGG